MRESTAAPFVDRIATTGSGGPSYRPHPRREISPPIGRKWALGAKRPGEVWEPYPYNAALSRSFRGQLRLEHLQRAAREVIRRHSILSCGLRFTGEEWFFLADGAAAPRFISLDASGRSDAEVCAKALLSEAIWQPFDLGMEGPLRLAVVKVSDEHYLFGFVIHHLYVDGYAMVLCARELAAFYHAFCQASPPALAELPIQYFDYMTSIEEWTQTTAAQDHITFWTRYLEEARGIPVSRGTTFTARQFMPSATTCAAIANLLQSESMRAHMFWEAAHHAALWHLSGQADITTLSFDIGRRDRALLGLIGEFDNRLPLRSRLSPDLTFRQLLRQLRDTKHSFAAYRSTPYDLIASLCPFATHEVGQVNFHPGEFFAFPDFGTALELPQPSGTGIWTAPFSWEMRVTEGSEITVLCCGDTVSPFTPTQLSLVLERLADRLVTTPDQRLGDMTFELQRT